jgi:GAF domain-containing protein
VAATLDYHEALNSLVKNAAECLKAKASSVRLLDKSGNTLEIAATFGLSKSYLAKGPVEVDKSPIDRLALSGQVVQIRDVTKDGRFQYPEEAKKEGIKSVACVPLKCRDKLLGVLRIYTEKTHLFVGDEIAFISILASQAGVVIRNAHRHERLKKVNLIGESITSQLDLRKVLDNICQSAVHDMSAKGASITLINKNTGRLEPVATQGLSEVFLAKGPLMVDKSISECLKGQNVVIEDVEKDERIQYPEAVKKDGIKSIICIPLKLRENVIGTLRIYTAYPYKVEGEDLVFLNILADFGAVAVENARLYEHIRRDYEDLQRDVWKWYNWGKRQPQI